MNDRESEIVGKCQPLLSTFVFFDGCLRNFESLAEAIEWLLDLLSEAILRAQCKTRPVRALHSKVQFRFIRYS